MWRQGARLEGRLIESPEKGYWIVSIDGKLVGVKNESGQPLKVDQKVELEVLGESPVRFRLLGKVQRQSGLNVRI